MLIFQKTVSEKLKLESSVPQEDQIQPQSSPASTVLAKWLNLADLSVLN